MEQPIGSKQKTVPVLTFLLPWFCRPQNESTTFLRNVGELTIWRYRPVISIGTDVECLISSKLGTLYSILLSLDKVSFVSFC
jgi:hypothetical protein